MSQSYTLYGDKVVVEAVESASTLFVTDATKWRYKVVAVGTGRKTEFGQTMLPPVSVGDIVIIDPISIATVEIKGKNQKIVNSADIIAKEE